MRQPRPCATPTPERLARGDLEFEPIRLEPKTPPITVWRKCVGLYGLHRSGTLEDRHVTAAELWARDYETGVLGARDPDCRGSGPRGDAHDAQLARAAASGRHDYIRRAIGGAGESLMMLLMIDGLSIAAMGARLGRDQKLVSGAVLLLLDQVVEQYDEMQGTFWRG